jgi:hypothetical protein
MWRVYTRGAKVLQFEKATEIDTKKEVKGVGRHS